MTTLLIFKIFCLKFKRLNHGLINDMCNQLLMWTGGSVPFQYRTDPKTLVWTGYIFLQIYCNP